MKSSSKLFTVVFVTLITVSSMSFASGNREKVISKAKEAIEEGAPDDWMLLAQQSEYLLTRDIGLSMVKEWLEKSIKLKEDVYNLELMGDYYKKCNLNKQATAYYVEAMKVKKANDVTINTRSIESKIMEVRN